jgi:hypothetical protein
MRIQFTENRTVNKLFDQDDIAAIERLDLMQFDAWKAMLHEMAKESEQTRPEDLPERPQTETLAGLRNQAPAEAIKTVAEVIDEILGYVNSFDNEVTLEAYTTIILNEMREKIDSYLTPVQAESMLLQYTGNTIHSHWENNRNAPR